MASYSLSLHILIFLLMRYRAADVSGGPSATRAMDDGSWIRILVMDGLLILATIKATVDLGYKIANRIRYGPYGVPPAVPTGHPMAMPLGI